MARKIQRGLFSDKPEPDGRCLMCGGPSSGRFGASCRRLLNNSSTVNQIRLGLRHKGINIDMGWLAESITSAQRADLWAWVFGGFDQPAWLEEKLT